MLTAEQIAEAASRVDSRKAKRNGTAVGKPLPEGLTPDEMRQQLGAAWLSDVSPDAPPPMLFDRLAPDGGTILFGPGGVGKGTVASAWIKRLTDLGHRVLILDYENHPDEWARRLDGLKGDRSKVLHVAPLGAGWNSIRGPLWAQQGEIRRLVEAFSFTYLVVDSLGFACAGVNPADAEAAIQYNAGVSYIGLPSLSLAHVNRANDMTMPFGSMFWHAAARTTWSMEPQGPGVAVLTHRKSNNYEPLPKQQVTATWHDGRPIEVSETKQADALADRAHGHLSLMGPSTLKELMTELNSEFEGFGEVKSEAVRKAMARDDTRFACAGKGTAAKWRAL